MQTAHNLADERESLTRLNHTAIDRICATYKANGYQVIHIAGGMYNLPDFPRPNFDLIHTPADFTKKVSDCTLLLTAKTMILVDSANTLGVRMMHSILKAANFSGSKVILLNSHDNLKRPTIFAPKSKSKSKSEPAEESNLESVLSDLTSDAEYIINQENLS